MNDDDAQTSEWREVGGGIGGLVDRSLVSLGIYGDDLDPDAISAALGCRPSSSHRKGEPRKKNPARTWPTGAWLLRVEGSPPEGPEELTLKLLRALPADLSTLRDLSKRYSLVVSYGIFLDAWNRTFDLESATLERLSAIGATMRFDIYGHVEEHGDPQVSP